MNDIAGRVLAQNLERRRAWEEGLVEQITNYESELADLRTRLDQTRSDIAAIEEALGEDAERLLAGLKDLGVA